MQTDTHTQRHAYLPIRSGIACVCYVCMYTHVCMYIYIYVYIYEYTYLYLWVCLFACTHIWVYVNMYVVYRCRRSFAARLIIFAFQLCSSSS